MELIPLYVERLNLNTATEVATYIKDKLGDKTFVYVQVDETTLIPTVSVGNKLGEVLFLEASEKTNGCNILMIKFGSQILVFNADTNAAEVQIYADRVVIVYAGDPLRAVHWKSHTLFLQDK